MSNFLLILSSLACQKLPTSNYQNTPSESSNKAHAEMFSKNGSKISGMVHFKENKEGLIVHYQINGFKKGKSYGFHIHENGDCSAQDAKSAGKHYMPIAPTGGTSLDSSQKHGGDLPQIEATHDGMNEGSFIVKEISLKEKNPILYKSIIIHDGPDNIKKKSAPKIACGVITETI